MCSNPCKAYKKWEDVIYSEGLEESPSPCIFCMRNYYEDV